jgi:hypothetical protein
MVGIYENFGFGSKINSASEIFLQPRTAADISINVLKQSVQMFLTGSGPGTFVYDYIKFRPRELSQDAVISSITFFSAPSEFITRAAVTGILGVAALLLVIVVGAFSAFRRLITRENDLSPLNLGIFCGWLAVSLAIFFYPFNFSLMMLFWMFLALVAISEEKNIVLEFKTIRAAYAISLISVAVLVLNLGLIVWGAKRYYAETEYLAAAKALQTNDLDAAMKNLERAANSTERLQDNYLTSLAQIYLVKA